MKKSTAVEAWTARWEMQWKQQLADRLAAATAEAASAAAASEEERARIIKTLHSAALCAVRCCAPGDKALRALIARAAAALSRLPRERNLRKAFSREAKRIRRHCIQAL